MMKKFLIVLGSLSLVILVVYCLAFYIKTSQPAISKQPPIWELQGLTESEYKTQ